MINKEQFIVKLLYQQIACLESGAAGALPFLIVLGAHGDALHVSPLVANGALYEISAGNVLAAVAAACDPVGHGVRA
jgi:hypothetical protein